VPHVRAPVLRRDPATALNRLADMISGRAAEEPGTTNLFIWVRWIVTKEENFSEYCRGDWKIDFIPVYCSELRSLLLRKAQLP